MVDNSWVFDLESKIFTYVKTKARKELSGKYPDIKFTTTDKPSDSSNSFPCVYIYETGGLEIGNDLQNISINGVNYSMQVEIYSNTSKDDAKFVSRIITSIFKELGFSVSQFPESVTGTIHRLVLRVRRNIGQADNFI